MRSAPSPSRGDHSALPDSTVTDHSDRTSRRDAGAERGMVPGWHHIGQREQVRQECGVIGPFGPEQGAFGEWYPDPLGLGTTSRDPVGARLTPTAAADARGLHPVAAVLAVSIVDRERADDEVSRPQGADLGADLGHGADELVPLGGRPIHRQHTPVPPQIRSTDAAGLDRDDDVGRVQDLRVVDLVNADVLRSVHEGCEHDDLSDRERWEFAEPDWPGWLFYCPRSPRASPVH